MPYDLQLFNPLRPGQAIGMILHRCPIPPQMARLSIIAVQLVNSWRRLSRVPSIVFEGTVQDVEREARIPRYVWEQRR